MVPRSETRNDVLAAYGRCSASLAFSCLMLSAANTHIRGFGTGALATAHQILEHFRILPPLRFLLFFELSLCCSFATHWPRSSSLRLPSTLFPSSSRPGSSE